MQEICPFWAKPGFISGPLSVSQNAVYLLCKMHKQVGAIWATELGGQISLIWAVPNVYTVCTVCSQMVDRFTVIYQAT